MIMYSQIPVRRRPVHNYVYCFKLKFNHLLASICEYFTVTNLKLDYYTMQLFWRCHEQCIQTLRFKDEDVYEVEIWLFTSTQSAAATNWKLDWTTARYASHTRARSRNGQGKNTSSCIISWMFINCQMGTQWLPRALPRGVWGKKKWRYSEIQEKEIEKS